MTGQVNTTCFSRHDLAAAKVKQEGNHNAGAKEKSNLSLKNMLELQCHGNGAPLLYDWQL